MVAAANAERTECAGRRHPHLAHALDDGCRRAGTQPVEKDVEPVTGTLGNTADRAVHRIRDPAVEPEVRRLAEDVIAEADALDPAPDSGIEPHGGRVAVHRRSLRR